MFPCHDCDDDDDDDFSRIRAELLLHDFQPPVRLDCKLVNSDFAGVYFVR